MRNKSRLYFFVGCFFGSVIGEVNHVTDDRYDHFHENTLVGLDLCVCVCVSFSGVFVYFSSLGITIWGICFELFPKRLKYKSS